LRVLSSRGYASESQTIIGGAMTTSSPNDITQIMTLNSDLEDLKQRHSVLGKINRRRYTQIVNGFALTYGRLRFCRFSGN